MSTTPMMQQYADAKAVCGDALLLFRMGDFYELFYDDAKAAAQLLGLALTSRDKGENPVPMAGFPHHQLEPYLRKLIGAGRRAAVCEQMEDPRKATGLVKREVTRVVTPGTLTDDCLLDPRESNYLAAVAWPAGSRDEEGVAGLAWCDLSTGRFLAAVLPRSAIGDQLARLAVSECLFDERTEAPPATGPITMTSRPPWCFAQEHAEKILREQFGAATLEGFGFTDSDRLAVRAAGAVLDYLRDTQRTALPHLDRLTPYRQGTSLDLDASTRRSLELTRTIRDGRREGSLLSVLDRTKTPMGARLLGDWLANPLTDAAAIGMRHDAVSQLALPFRYSELRNCLSNAYDLERLIARVSTGRASPRDLQFIGRTLERLPSLRENFDSGGSVLLIELRDQLEPLPDLCERIASAFVDTCPIQARDGGFIRSGYSAELDRLRSLAHGGKQWIAEYQSREVRRTGIPSLKVGYNRVFGYYIELTNAHRERAPAEYIRKQTLKNAERYITPELKEREEQVLTADERAKELEYDLFVELRDRVAAESRTLRRTASALAHLDVLRGLADLALDRKYCRPKLVDGDRLRIVDGRHPVLDVLEPEGTFVPNDTTMGGDDGSIHLITGPNMAGKSTYIRQVALITLMAQIGSYVPAREAEIGVADRIFARVGASDELSRGQSTFMVEMTETARILNTSTRRSLVILDEIGRGTSTYDGVSLAWAVVEHLHDRIGCRTFFATHYHELADLAASLAGMRNFNVSVREWQDDVLFLHKIAPGPADKSYGIHVARLAGVPREVNERAKQILAHLEDEHLDGHGKPRVARRERTRRGDIQLTLFSPHEHHLLREIRELDLDQIAPIDGLRRIQAWQEALRGEDTDSR
ncbi:MAG: DNA mismatch repair protein MutS [Planctomycetes bacterium]|nr:DNA mismatch repair protein MutS [Planctomycetota bacterium]